jgi:predicted RNase H-like HicB family nuclease
MMAQFFGILDGSGKAWGVRVPDLPGVHGGGVTPDEARQDAISAAREWAEHQASRGVALPAASPLERVIRNKTQSNEVVLMITF